MNSPDSSSVILLGMKHSGKSTHGRRLAAMLGCPFADLDEITEREYDPNRSRSCREIYAAHGKEYFAELETRSAAVLAGRLAREAMIAALGGGTIENDRAMSKLRGAGIMVYLKDSEERLFERIMRNGLPAFLSADDPRGSFDRLYKRRTELYRRSADLIVDIENKNVEGAFEALLAALRDQTEWPPALHIRPKMRT